MPNVCVAAGVRLAVLMAVVWLGAAPVWGQLNFGNPYDAGIARAPFGSTGWGARESVDPTGGFPEPGRAGTAGASTVSAEVLRHPLSSKARRLFAKAMHLAELGNHHGAIDGLREALVKCPADAPYVHNLLGLEYMEVEQYGEAKASFAEAARLMPRESSNHSNLGLSLAIAGEWDTAEQEERKAIQLDKSNSKAQLILEALLAHKRNAALAKP